MKTSKEIIKKLKSLANPKNVEGMARFGISSKNTLGISVVEIRKMGKEIGKNHGAKVIQDEAYPGWEPNPGAPFLKHVKRIYEEVMDKTIELEAIHGGLECGIIGKNYPNMDMISFGPNITGPHSPDEQVQISSVNKFWSYLLEVLKQI